MAERKSAIGFDYGTNSVRALVVDIASGEEIGTSVFEYPGGDAGILLDPKDPHLARQSPIDYMNGAITSARGALAEAKRTAGFSVDQIVGIGVDTTGSTPIPVDDSGRPLAADPRWAGNPAAHAWLWKDHTAYAEAAEITDLAKRRGEPYLAKCGGTYSSEWFWSKILHCRRTSPEVFDAAASWVELADFIPAFLTGTMNPRTMSRGICAAGHKAMYHTAWNGLPSEDFLATLDPQLVKVRQSFAGPVVPSDHVAGTLTAEIAAKIGIPAGIPVAVGAFDAHMGAVGAGIGPGTLVKIIGTSTCDMMVAPQNQPLADIPGLCGIVPGSVIPGMYGLEAGQSAVGDIFNWFVRDLTPSGYGSTADEKHRNLTTAAMKLKPGESGLVALDWNNGNRTILVDPLLTGVLIGQTLHTTAPEVYRALVEATAFGALTIIRRFEEYGCEVREVINCGGIAEKNDFVMQIYADVCNRPMKISRSAQTCALGAAIFGAVAGGAYPDTASAQAKMTGVKTKVFVPTPDAVSVYAGLYEIYRAMHDAFGTGATTDLRDAMKRLIAIREKVRKR
ncbi:MAG: ribulokinase [Planctomycetia bacterium]|nr:ribulokinase [Planctomycetia bacterium]